MGVNRIFFPLFFPQCPTVQVGRPEMGTGSGKESGQEKWIYRRQTRNDDFILILATVLLFKI